MKRIHPIENKKCLNCGKDFIPKSPTSNRNPNKYCSRECFNIGRLKPRIEGDCIACGKHFVTKYTTTNWQYTHRIKRMYCSTECRIAGKPKKSVTCIQCGKVFFLGPSFLKHNAAKYCSKECQFAHMRGENSPFFDVNTRVSLVCRICKKHFTRERWRLNQKNHTGDFCSQKCHYKFIENPLAPLPPRQEKEYVRLRKVYLAEHPTCEKCDSTEKLELDHKVAIAIAPERYKDPTNFQTLCQKCHKTKTKEDIRKVLALRAA